MLGILWLILKIIGWVLLAIVCLFFAVLMLVLFVPVPYRLQAGFGEKQSYRLCVFGIQIFPKKERAGRKKRTKKKEKPGNGVSARETSETEVLEAERSETERYETERSKKEASKREASEKEVPEKEVSEKKVSEKTPDAGGWDGAKAENDPAKTAAPKDGGSGPRSRRRFHSTQRKKRRSKEKNRNKGAKKTGKKGMDFDALRVKWELLRAELTDDGNKRALRHGFSELARILRHCGPRKVKADFAYSLADPANTGYATAVLSLCPFIYGKGCNIIPDFASEKFYAKGWVDVRGHVRLIHFLCSGVRLLIDKDIRAVIRKIRG